MTWKRFGRAVSLVTDKATSESFAIGLEAVQSGRGTLVAEPQTDYSGDGIRFQKGDVLFGKLRPYLAKAWHADRHGAAVGDFHVYRPNNGVYGNYVKYVLLSRAFLEPVTASVTGAKMPRVDWYTTRAVECFMPPEDEQRAIADFLDEQTSRIDTLIDKQTQLIATLLERRTVIRAKLATGTLRTSGVPLIASGLPWASLIPEGWSVAPLTALAVLESGHTPSRSRPELWTECHIPWISLNDVSSLTTSEYIAHTANKISDAGVANSSARVLPAGTVVLSRDATIGRSSIMAVPMATSQHFAAWVCGPRIAARYLWLLFTSAMQPHFDTLTDGSTIKTIGMGDLRSFKVPVPPLDEQRRIVTDAEVETAKIDTLITKTEQHIALAKERRSALITAAVTGQIDVRTAARAEKVGT